MPGSSSAPQTSNTSPTTSGLPHSGAPAVTDPLPESVIAGDPCEALTRQQVEQALGRNAPQGERADLEAGPGCNWHDQSSGAGFSVGYSTATRQGLSAYYANTRPQAEVWREEDPIDGLPAVSYQRTKQDFSCAVTVGLADAYAIDVIATPSRAEIGRTDSCDLSRQLAEIVVENLQQKAGR